MDLTLITILVVAICVVTVIAAWVRLKIEPSKARGSEPRQGDHVLTSDYQSGLGGHSNAWRVPADPQEYAKTFVPRDTK